MDNIPNIKELKVNWDEYMRAGVICRLHVGRWRARTKLSEADLGIRLNGAESLIDLGEKRLLPQVPPSSRFYLENRPRTYIQVFESIEARARHALERLSFPTYWGPFVPATAFKKWEEDLKDCQSLYFAARDEVLQQWDHIISQVLEEYRDLARDSWSRLSKLDPEDARRYAEREVYVKTFLEQIERRLPSRSQFKESFYMDPEYIWIPLPSILAEEQARADAIRRENELQNLRSEKLAAAIREMNSRITEETRRKKQELIDQFLEDTAGYLRSLIVDACQDVMDSMKKNGRLVGKASQRLTNLIETINTLNFLDDQDVNQAIDAIRAQLSIAPGQRRPEDIQRTLADVRVVMLGELYQLTRESNRAGLSSPPPSPQDFRRARRNLNLSTPIAGEDLTRRPRAFQEALL